MQMRQYDVVSIGRRLSYRLTLAVSASAISKNINGLGSRNIVARISKPLVLKSMDRFWDVGTEIVRTDIIKIKSRMERR